MEMNKLGRMHSIGAKPSRLIRYFTSMVDMDKRYGLHESTTEKRRLKDICSNAVSGLKNHIPILNVLKTYNVKKYLLSDIIAGLAIVGLHFPQGLAYGILAGLTPNVGMISTLFPVLLYMVFGSAPHASIGTNAITSIIVGDLFLEDDIKKYLGEITSQRNSVEVNATKLLNVSVETPFDEHNEIRMHYKISLVAGVTFYTGLIFLVMAIMKMGFIVTYLSQSFMSGFTTGVGVHIFSSQIKVAMGLKFASSTGIGKLVMLYISVFQNILTTNVADLIVTVICVAVLLLVKILINEKFKLKTPIPIDFILLIVATLISHFAGLTAKFNTHSLGKIELGLPAPEIPSFQPAGMLIVYAIEVAMVTFFLNISVTKLVAKHNGYEIDEDIETSAYAVTSIVSSFFSNIPPSIAPPRALLLSTMGAKTTLNSVTTSVVMLALIFYFGQFFESCPRSVLASMIMVAMRSLLKQAVVLPKLWKINKNDFTMWLFAALTCILLDIKYGLALGVLVSLISVINQSQRGRVSVLEKSDFEDLYLDKHDYSGVSEIRGIKIIRIEASLYFATADKFRKSITKCISCEVPSKTEKEVISSELGRNKNSLDARAFTLTSIKEDPDSDDEEQHDMNTNTDLERNENDPDVCIFRLTSIQEDSDDSDTNNEEQNDKNKNGDLGKHEKNADHILRVKHIEGDPDMDSDDEEERHHAHFNVGVDKTIHIVIIDCIPINFIDVTGLDMLKLVILELGCLDIHVYLARCSRYMLRMLEKSDFFECVPREHVFVDLPDAVAFAKTHIIDKVITKKEIFSKLGRFSFSSLMVDELHDPFHDLEISLQTVH